MDVQIVGICRFSFAGRGDWAYWRGVPRGDEASHRDRVAAGLYAGARMARRLWLLENVLLRTLSAQHDRDFRLIVLTSDLMPGELLGRLRAVVARLPQAECLVSAAADVNAAIVPRLREMRADDPRPLVQFRIDDDDGLYPHYIGNLRDVMVRFADFSGLAYSTVGGLAHAIHGPGQERFLEYQQPFNSVGTALKTGNPDLTVFSHGHFGLGRRLPSFSDRRGLAGIMIKAEGHDSAAIRPEGPPPRDYRDISRPLFEERRARSFPALAGVDFGAMP